MTIDRYLTGAILRTGLLQHFNDIQSKGNDVQWWTNYGPRVSRGTCFNCMMWKLFRVHSMHTAIRSP